MIHLPTMAGGRVSHLVRAGAVVRAGEALVKVQPAEGPLEEILAPIDGVVEVQRLRGREAPPFAMVVGVRRVVLAARPGRVQWLASLGPVGTTTTVALIESDGVVRPHRAGGVGFVGRRYAELGDRVDFGAPLVEIRGEELG